MRNLPLIGLALLIATGVSALEPVSLPAPRTGSGKPLMQALKERRTTREFSEKALSRQMLSDLLWAAFGVNRPEDGKRTAPSAWNHQEVDLYVFLQDGVYVYEAVEHRLRPVLEGDHRAMTSTDDFGRIAPVSIAYVADHSRTPKTPTWEKPFYAGIHTGFIGQNVYLYCASAGLGTVIHDSTADGALAKALGLRRDQQIILAQAIGYPSQ